MSDRSDKSDASDDCEKSEITMSEDEFYLDERPGANVPAEITPEWEEPGSGGGAGGGGGPGGGGGGGGWGPGLGGGGGWYYPGSSEEPEEPEGPEEEPDESAPENGKILKRSGAGTLLRCDSGGLLLGDLTCKPDPHFLLWIRGQDCEEHTQCVLWRLSDGRSSFDAEGVEENPEEGVLRILRKYIFLQAGRFDLLVRWQGGHYDHAKVGEMRISLFGVDLGWKVYPLSWITAATVQITQEGKVFVNGVEGKI